MGPSNLTGFVRAEIDLSALKNNFLRAKKLALGREVMPVVKADAYGHGAAACAGFLERACGVKRFCVARLNEAIELRASGLKGSILILDGFAAGEETELVAGGFEVSVSAGEQAAALSRAAKRVRKRARIHLKINTGMNRLGATVKDGFKIIEKIKETESLKLAGVYTHFACADEKDSSMTLEQAALLALLRRAAPGALFHAANSAALMKYPFSLFDAVRPGIMLYGSFGDEAQRKRNRLKPVMSLKSRIIAVNNLEKGQGVSYGCTYRAKKRERVAVVGIGYADGFRRCLTGRGEVYINGKRAPVLGRVCMDMIMVRPRGAVKVNDEALVFGRDAGLTVPVENVAAEAGTIAYEIFTGISERVPRIYRGGKG